MEIKHLKYFVTAVDTGSLSKASDKLAVSQPSLSQHVAGMETELGVQLLLRSASGIRPTEAGNTLYRHACAILRQVDQMRSEVARGDRSEAGQVVVGLPTSVAAALAVPLFNRIRDVYPGIDLQLIEGMSGALADQLANGRLDMAILFRDTETRGLTILPLLREQLFVFGARHVGDMRSPVCPLTELAGVPMVLPGKANGLRLLIERGFAQARLKLTVVGDIDSLPTMLTLARDERAATILSATLTYSLIGQSLLARRIVEPSLERTISLCLSSTLPRNAASLAVQNTIVDLMDELSGLWQSSHEA